ncbi:MAG: ABC transporter ATP-binding protein [Planctomycetota bacterium]
MSTVTQTETIAMSPKPMVPIDVEINGLTKAYGDTIVVDNLSLSIAKGSFLGLIGANGAGKSTTLKMLAGMLETTRGSASVLGTPIEQLGPKELARIGYVPDSHQIYRWMTIHEAVWFCRRLNPNWNDNQCAELLKLFRLDEKKKVKSLSKGMLAKLGLALALSHEPDLLFLDEPMSGLDPIASEEFLDGVLKTVSQRDCTVILSSHSIDDVQRMSDSICLLHEGKMLAHRQTENILHDTKCIRFVYDGNAEPPTLPSTIRSRNDEREWLITVEKFSPLMLEKLASSPGVSCVSVEDMTLEEVYKDYVRGQS